MRHRPTRVYARGHGPPRRLWADFRDYRDVGGRQEALVPPGRTQATTDPDEAARLVAERLKQLEAARRDRSLYGLSRGAATLGAYAAEHLTAKAQSAKVTTRWLEQAQRHLEQAVAFFGDDRPILGIQPADVRRWIASLRTLPSRRGEKNAEGARVGTLTDGTVRHYLNSLSALYRRAQEDQRVPPGFNPPGVLLEKPVGRRCEAVFLEVPDAAYLLECARQFHAKRADLACPFLYPLLAAFLLTGGRLREVLALQVSDVNFERGTVTFRPNVFRPRLKTEGSARVVPLWPQLAEILRGYLNARTAAEVLSDHPERVLLFPAMLEGEAMLDTLPRKAFAALLERAGMTGQGITQKVFRHTYTSARLQTLDHGAPVSPFTVARELGHGGTRLVDRIYGHLGEVRHRAAAVEYRVETFPQLAERLTARGFVTTPVTAPDLKGDRAVANLQSSNT